MDIEQPLAQYRDDPVKTTAYRYEFEWRGFNTLVRQLYSGGYALADVAANITAMFTSIRNLDEDYRRYNPSVRYGLYGWGYGTDYELVLQNLCWLTALGEPGQLHTYLARCNPAGEDRLFDLIADRLNPGRSIGTQTVFPKRAVPLLAVLDAPASEQSGLLVKAFKAWKRRLPDRGRPPDDVEGSYTGYWYWDGALVATLFGIDDTELRGDANYPADLVQHGRSQAT